MAALWRYLTPELFSISRCIANELSIPVLSVTVRNLYTKGALGIDNYAKTRENIHKQFVNIVDTFKSKMNDYAEPTSTNLIFTEDLKHMVHLAEAVPEDLDLILKMMKRFNQQNQQLRFGSFVFGPVVMRMYHFLDKPEEALKAFRDPDLEGFFDQMMAYQVLLDLLYKNNMFDKVLEVFEIVKEKQIQSTKYPKNVVTLVLAACYKMNTPESFKYAMDLWKDLQTVGHVPMRRATTFAAALSLNQNSPHICLEIISGVKQQGYFTIRNLKAAALADVGRVEDSLPVLRSALQIDDPETPKYTFSKEVMVKVEEAIKRLENKSLSSEFEQLKKQLVNQGHITNAKLEDLLCTEIERVNSLNFFHNRDRRFLAASFNRERSASQGRSYSRPGLKDLY